MALYSHFHSNLAGVIDTDDTDNERFECHKKTNEKMTVSMKPVKNLYQRDQRPVSLPVSLTPEKGISPQNFFEINLK